MVRLDELAKIQIGKTPKRAVNEYWGVGFPWVSIADMKTEVITNTKEQITEQGIKECGCKLIPKGSIIMSFKLSVGKLAFTGTDLFTNEAICAILIKDKKKMDPKYFYYALKNTKLTGSNMAVMGHTLNTESLNSLKIPVFENLSDQIRIADILSQAESLIAQRKQSISLLDEFLKATFLDMFGQGENNLFPVQKLNDVTTKITDGEHGTVARLESGRLYFMARNITINNTIDLTEVSFISETDHEKIYKRCNPEVGDLMMVCVGATIGKVALVPIDIEPFSMARSVALVKPNKKIIKPAYLLWFFNSDLGKRQVKSSTNEAAQGGLYTGKLKEIKIPIPPINLQTKFGSIVEKVETLKTQYQQDLSELQNMYGVLSQKAFKGDLSLDQGFSIAAEEAATYSKKK
jgi:type I restriction enzyme S subunit